LDLQTNNEVAAEVGPLRYMSEITGKPMNVIVNWFTLLIVFVFDPLAISMVIALNKLTKTKKETDGNQSNSINDNTTDIHIGDGVLISDSVDEEVLQPETTIGEPIETNEDTIEIEDRPIEEQIKKEKEEVIFVPTDDEVAKELYGEVKNPPAPRHQHTYANAKRYQK